MATDAQYRCMLDNIFRFYGMQPPNFINDDIRRYLDNWMAANKEVMDRLSFLDGVTAVGNGLSSLYGTIGQKYAFLMGQAINQTGNVYQMPSVSQVVAVSLNNLLMKNGLMALVQAPDPAASGHTALPNTAPPCAPPGPPGTSGPIAAIGRQFGVASETRSPLALDLDGDGIETLGQDFLIRFDHDANGFAELTGWIGPDDGLLVLDRNGNGMIDNGTELFGNHTPVQGGKAPHGFAALAALDGNGDGRIDAADAAFAQLRVWVDANSNGRTDWGELRALSMLGIASIGVAHGAGTGDDGKGNVLGETGSFTLTSGSVRTMVDVWFGTDLAQALETELLDIPLSLAILPMVSGAGNVRSLHQAMVRDSEGVLEGLVREYIATPDATERAAVLERLIFRWAGVDGVDPESRASSMIYGNAIGDARKLEALEEFLGQEYYGVWCWNERDPNPHGPAAAILLHAFQDLMSWIDAELLLQTHLAPYVDALVVMAGNGSFSVDASGVFALLQQTRAMDPARALADLMDLGRALPMLDEVGQRALDSLRGFGDSASSDAFLALLALVGSGLATDDDDYTSGDEGADNLFGLGGADVLYGQGGDDTLTGGAGDDFMHGGEGADTYVVQRGTGHDIIHNEDTDTPGTAPDVLRLTGGITQDDITLGRDGYDLIVTLDDGSSVRVYSQFDISGFGTYAIDAIRFDDGTDLTAEAIRLLMGRPTDGDDLLIGDARGNELDGGAGDDMIYGLAGPDTLLGGDGNDLIDGGDGADKISTGRGNDTVRGGEGSDVYVYRLGHGHDFISDDAADAATSRDVLRLGPGIAQGDVQVTRLGDSLHLRIGDEGSVTIGSWFYGPEYQLYRIRFADGSAWRPETVQRLLFQGSDGDDWLPGDEVANTIRGAAGNDYMMGEGGDDTLYGQDGSDTMMGGTGNDLLAGGGGDDWLDGGDGDDTLQGGTGNDLIEDMYGRNLIDAGSGDDTLRGLGLGGADRVTLGSGQDRIIAAWSLTQSTEVDVITDFQTGATGDILDLSELGYALQDYQWGANPFLAGYLRLVQSGGATLVQVDHDGATGFRIEWVLNDEGTEYLEVERREDFRTLLRLEGVTAADLTAENFGNGFTPDDRGLTWIGTVRGDQKWGSASRDSLSGDAGDDAIYGAEGADSLFGGAGNDWLDGGAGADAMEGGDDSDYMFGDSGDDTLRGDDGHDHLDGGDGADWLAGGRDNDTVYGGMGDDALFGGSGDDLIEDTQGRNRIDAGRGNDTVTGVGLGGRDRILLGDGQDRVIAAWSLHGPQEIDLVQDFVTGAGGDILDLGQILGAVQDYVPGSNPFLSGHLRLVERDGGTLVQVDHDGRHGSRMDWVPDEDGTYVEVEIREGFRSILRLEGVRPGDLTVENLGNGHTPDDIGMVWSGGSGADTVWGSLSRDNLAGGGGDDQLYGDYGADTLSGDDGQDWLDGGDGADSLAGGAGDDYLIGAAGEDRLSGDDGNDVLDGGEGADQLAGGRGDDTLYGGAGADVLDGRTGTDWLYGGEGADQIIFRKGGGQDWVGDFVRADGDRLLLDQALWGGGLTAGQVVNRHASVGDDGNVRLSFAGGDMLVLEGVADLIGLRAAIDLF